LASSSLRAVEPLEPHRSAYLHQLCCPMKVPSMTCLTPRANHLALPLVPSQLLPLPSLPLQLVRSQLVRLQLVRLQLVHWQSACLRLVRLRWVCSPLSA
jgi:hypothetical protein